ncbi:MAG: hypothetical protein JNL74_11645 [Fibrobacteres bacterium]|nr:hypothetical protein [Fibrobacterota bacterium]
MQTDFHYYAIYALARCAGYTPAKASTLAYASQYTDDADDGRTIYFKNGGSFNPVLTAHKSLSFANLTLDVQKKIHMSFHFLPAMQAEDGFPRRKLVTHPGCQLAEDTVKRAMDDINAPDGLHGLGIALHSYADTYSHDGFSGMLGPENDTESVTISEKGSIAKWADKVWHSIMEFFVPCVGHGELLYLPDTPYTTWGYFDYYRQKELNPLDNTPKFMIAAEKIYEKLGGQNWDKHKAAFLTAFKFEGSLEQRSNNWFRMINDGSFGYKVEVVDIDAEYDPLKWKQEAMEWTSDKGISKSDSFESSNFYHFHSAARKQRTLVLSKMDEAKLDVKTAPLMVFLWKFIGFFHSLFGANGRTSFTWKAVRRAAFRFFIYGSMMIVGEVGFYTLCKIGRSVPLVLVNDLFKFEWLVDPRLNLTAVWDAPIIVLYGQASLWMFFVYGCIGLFGIEPVYKRIKHSPIILRGLTYMFIILFMECLTGWILHWTIKYDVWYYGDKWDILKYTSWAIAPLWFITGLLSENFVKFVNRFEELKKAN